MGFGPEALKTHIVGESRERRGVAAAVSVAPDDAEAETATATVRPGEHDGARNLAVARQLQPVQPARQEVASARARLRPLQHPDRHLSIGTITGRVDNGRELNDQYMDLVRTSGSQHTAIYRLPFCV